MKDIEKIRVAVGEVVERWRPQRDERMARVGLDPVDFAELADAGFLLASVPTEHGGSFESASTSARAISDLLRAIAVVDPSVALVSAMHPGVTGLWAAFPKAATPALEPAWQAQRAFVFDSAKSGEWWGTITSEPGSGGDMAATRAVARREPGDDPLRYRLTGDKHFGSGSGVTSFMLTTGRPEDEPESVAQFFIDQRNRPWDGSAGCRLLAEWDGFGMRATQSHAMHFEDCPVTRVVDHGYSAEQATAAASAGVLYFASVVLGVVDAAVAEARAKLKPKSAELRPYERMEWAKAVNDAWVMAQTHEGALRAVEERSLAAASVAIVRAKVAGAELAESCLERICRVVGGGTFSQRSPFGRWRQDVRALGFLRPPWAFTHDTLFGLSWAGR